MIQAIIFQAHQSFMALLEFNVTVKANSEETLLSYFTRNIFTLKKHSLLQTNSNPLQAIWKSFMIIIFLLWFAIHEVAGGLLTMENAHHLQTSFQKCGKNGVIFVSGRLISHAFISTVTDPSPSTCYPYSYPYSEQDSLLWSLWLSNKSYNFHNNSTLQHYIFFALRMWFLVFACN